MESWIELGAYSAVQSNRNSFFAEMSSRITLTSRNEDIIIVLIHEKQIYSVMQSDGNSLDIDTFVWEAINFELMI